MKFSILMAIAAIGMAHSAQAVEVTGGTAEIGYSTFTDETSLSRTFATGSLEVGFTRAFSLQFDLGMYGLNTINDTGRNMTLHTVFHVNETSSLGFFLGNDDIAGIGADIYGIEGGFEMPGVDVEVYLAAEDDGVDMGTMFGLNLHHSFDDKFGVTGKFDRISFDSGVDLTRFSVGVDYNLSPTAQIYGEIGSLSASVLGLSGSEGYVGIGARINFGASRGVTFNRRGLLEMLPGL